MTGGRRCADFPNGQPMTTPKPSDEVERVARAICDAHGACVWKFCPGEHQLYYALAAAAIAALTDNAEPTEAQIEAGMAELPFFDGEVLRDAVVAIYTAMRAAK